MIFLLNKTNYGILVGWYQVPKIHVVWRPTGSLYEHRTYPKQACNRCHYETKTKKLSSGR
jgi:hypothetical protein